MEGSGERSDDPRLQDDKAGSSELFVCLVIARSKQIVVRTTETLSIPFILQN